jgi:two-component system sensor histidine kinase AlgZ
MRDTQILSAFPEPAQTRKAAQTVHEVLVFDACHAGVVLRAVLFVELCLALGVMYLALSPLDWALRFSLATGAALPATLAWLLATCSVKKFLARMPLPMQLGLSSLAGGVCALYGCWLLRMAGLLEVAPWWSAFASGCWLSLLIVARRHGGAVGRVAGTHSPPFFVQHAQ